MALVEKTHGRDKRDRLAARPDSGDPLFHFIDRFNDIHGNLLERVVNRRKITSFDLFDILFKVQGREEEQARRILADAKAVEAAGAFAVVLEGIPRDLAKAVTASLSIPTIGIGAGADCDGQVLVIHDILGLCDKYSPKFVKRYADISATISSGIEEYIKEVKAGDFPTIDHSFK